MDMEHVEFLWSSEEINSNSNDYWLLVMDIARRFSVTRVTRYVKLVHPCATHLFVRFRMR